MTSYVAGFLFSEDRQHVTLVQKTRPEWQAGFFNAVGGHIEDGEMRDDAMTREFREETGADVRDWDCFALIRGRDWVVYFFRAFGDNFVIRTLTDEPVSVHRVDSLDFSTTIKNLSWLIPLALDETTDFVSAVTAE